MDILLPVHAAATLFMTGLIWFVQIVHYPLLGRMAATDVAAYEREHVRRTFRLVGPVMGVEALSAGLLVWALPGPLVRIGLGILVGIWLITAAVQVPLHGRLSERPDDATVKRLVRTNWLRTLAWSARSGLALAMLQAP